MNMAALSSAMLLRSFRHALSSSAKRSRGLCGALAPFPFPFPFSALWLSCGFLKSSKNSASTFEVLRPREIMKKKKAIASCQASKHNKGTKGQKRRLTLQSSR